MFSHKVKYILIFLLVGLGIAYIPGVLAQDEAEYSEEINSGFVFCDGKYIELPYKLEVRDLVIFINGIQITYPPLIRPNPIVEEDPGVPPGLSKEVSIYDLFKICWNERFPYYQAKLAYLWGKYSQEEAQEKMVDYYKSLPCLKEVERTDPDGVRITDYKGNSCIVSLYIFYELKPPPTEKELQERIENSANIYKERLEKGECYFFFFKHSAELSMTERKAVNVLHDMRNILLDNTMDNQSKAYELSRLAIIPGFNKAYTEMVISNFQQNDQFDERLGALELKIVEKYGPDAIHPANKDGDFLLQQMKEISQETDQ